MAPVSLLSGRTTYANLLLTVCPLGICHTEGPYVSKYLTCEQRRIKWFLYPLLRLTREAQCVCLS